MFSLAAAVGWARSAGLPGWVGDGSGTVPAVPSGPDPAVHVGTGTVGGRSGLQGESWEVLMLLFGAAILVGVGILAFVVVQRTRLLARRRARLYGPVAAATVPVIVTTVAQDWREVAARAVELPMRFMSVLPTLARLQAGPAGQTAPTAEAVEAVEAVEPAETIDTPEPTQPPPPEQPPATPPQPPPPTIPVRPDTRAHRADRSRVNA